MIVKRLCATGYGFRIRRKLKFLEIELKAPSEKDLLIEVYAAGLNPVDYKIIYGLARIVKDPPRPFGIGFDVSGVVIGKGKAVSDFNLGDEIYSKVPWEQMGTIASKILVSSNMVALKPKNLTFSEAAGIPLVGCTVVESFKLADLKPGVKILIHAGSGGIGSFAIQYAKFLGAFVYTTTSTVNLNWVKELGADVLIDYKKENYLKIVKDVDVVFDTLGGKYTRQALNVVKKNGKIITIAGHHDHETLKKLGVAKLFLFLFKLKGFFLMYKMRAKGVFYKHVWSYPNQETLNYIRDLIEQGKIKAVVDREYKFNEAIDAISYIQKNRAKGKVIVNIKANSK